MSVYSLYDATVTPAKGALASLKRIITAAEAHDNPPPLTSRLYHDMKPLTFQVHYSTAQADKMACTLSGREPTPFQEDFTSYAEMLARIDQVLQTLNDADKDTINRIGETSAPTPIGQDRVEDIPRKIVASASLLPNIYFHLCMAYAILRKEGVPIGKRDFSRPFVSDYI
jgi:hypothetical protein